MLPRSKLLLSLSCAGLALAAFAPRAQAASILDDFSTSSAPIDCNTGVTCTTSNPINVDFSATRIVTVTDDASVTINSVMAGQLVYSATDGTADILLRYDLGNQDITDGGGNLDFVIGVISSDIAAAGALTVTITDASAGSDTEAFNLVASGSAYELSRTLSDFAVDLQHVNRIEIGIANRSGNVSLDYVLTPEPSTAGMLMLGLLGLARAGRRVRA